MLFVLLMQFLWRYIDELIGKGLEFNIILEFLLYTSATLVPMALPLSILMSSLMTFGNLGERYELTAIKASGISLQKIMRPLVFSVILISIGTFFFANNVLPYANLQMRTLLYDIQQQRPELQIKPGEFNNLIDGYSIRIKDKDPKTNTMYNVQIYDHSERRGNVSVVIADSGTMKMTPDEQNLLMTLHNGHSYNELQDMNTPEKKRSYPHRYDQFEKQEFLIHLTGFDLERSDQSLFQNHYAMMNLEQLSHEKDSISTEINEKEKSIYESLISVYLFKKREENKPFKKPKRRGSNIGEAEASFELPPPGFEKSHSQAPTKQKKDSGATKTDSAQTKALPTVSPIDIDSVFNILTLREKSRVGSSALSFARSSTNLIANSIPFLDRKIHRLRRYEIEWHRKFTISFACLLFLFIGAPLGAIIRKGGLGLPLVLSVIFFILYYILSLTGEKLVRESIVPSYQGMWLTSAIFGLAGSFLTYQATTDSSMLNLDTYLNFLKKYFGQRYNIVDKINIDKTIELDKSYARLDKIEASLFNLEESVDNVLLKIKEGLRLSDFISSLFTPQNDSNIILFERYYNNTFRIIINHPVFHKKTVRAKIYEFPSFSIEEMGDTKWRMALRIVLSLTIVLTPLVALRQYIRILLVRIKLRKIKQLLPELCSIIKRHESEF